MYILTLFDVRIYGKDGEAASPPPKKSEESSLMPS